MALQPVLRMNSLFTAVALTPREHSFPLLVNAGSVGAALTACLAFGFVTADVDLIPVCPRQPSGAFLSEDGTTGFFTNGASIHPVSSDSYLDQIEERLNALRTELIGNIQLQLVPLKTDQLILFTRKPQGFLSALTQKEPLSRQGFEYVHLLPEWAEQGEQIIGASDRGPLVLDTAKATLSVIEPEDIPTDALMPLLSRLLVYAPTRVHAPHWEGALSG